MIGRRKGGLALIGTVAIPIFVWTGSLAAQTAEEVHDRVVTLRDSIARKGEYETTPAYEERKARQRRIVDSLTAGTYPDTVPLDFGRYDADHRELPVRISSDVPGYERDAPRNVPLATWLSLSVPPHVAKRLKAAWNDPGAEAPRGAGRFWVEDDGSVYLDGRLEVLHRGERHLTAPGPIGVQVLESRSMPSIPLVPDRVVISAGGSYAASVKSFENALWDPETGDVITELGRCRSPTFSGDERYFACGRITSDPYNRVWVRDMERDTAVRLTGGSERWRIPTTVLDETISVAFTADPSPGHTLLIEGSWGELPDAQGRLILWAVDDLGAHPDRNTNTISLPGSGLVRRIVPSPDGEYYGVVDLPARLHEGGMCCRTGSPRLWLIEQGSGSVADEPREGGLTAFFPDGGRYLAGSEVRATGTGEVRTRLEPVGSEASRAVPEHVSPDGELVAGGHDGTTILWDADTGEVVRRIPVGPPLAFFPNGDLYLFDNAAMSRATFRVELRLRAGVEEAAAPGR